VWTPPITTSSTVWSLEGDTSWARLAAVGHDAAGDELHQGGLALAVAAQQTDPLAPAYLQGGVVQQRLETEAQGDFIEAYGRHEAAYLMRSAASNADP
jgi:hypothetical protein